MKTLFLAVTGQLQELGIFRTIDMDKGQLDRSELRPQVAFPCALVKCSFTFSEYGGGIKNRLAQVRIRLAFDQTITRTGTDVPDAARNATLSYIEHAEEVFEAFRRFETNEYSAFEVNEFIQEDRNDGLVVMRLSFSTNRIDVEQ